jgi:hypothetical protein
VPNAAHRAALGRSNRDLKARGGSFGANVRFAPESDQDRAALQYVAKGHLRTFMGVAVVALARDATRSWPRTYCDKLQDQSMILTCHIQLAGGPIFAL